MRALPIALSAALLVAPLQAGTTVTTAALVDSEPSTPLEAPELRIAALPAAPTAAEPEPAPAAPAPRYLPPPVAAPLAAGTVLASWYGPGFYGNRTACGQTLTEELHGVAHLTLPCGTLVTLRSGAATVTVPVVDNGPHVPGREFDLTYRTKVTLGCPDLCRLGWVR